MTGQKGAHVKNHAFKLGLALSNMAEIIAAALLIAVIILNLAQVFFRYVLVDPLSWSEESMRYSTTWLVLLAGSSALFRGEHMLINLFENIASKRIRNVIKQAVLLCIGGFCVLLMWEGFPAAIDNMRQVSPAMGIPMTVPYLAIPAGASLMLIKVICLMILPENAVKEEMRRENQS